MRRWVALTVLMVLTAGLVGATLSTVRYQTGADEGFYLAYAQRIAQEGLGVFPRLFQGYLHGDPANCNFPSPVRITPLLLAAASLRISGLSGFLPLSLLSLGSFLLLVAVTYFGVLRMRDEWTAFWCALLVGTAPLHLAMARRALTDTLGSMLFVLCLWVLLEALGRPATESSAGRRRWAGIAVLYTVTLLTKASMYLLIPISLFFIGAHAMLRRRRPGTLPILAVSLLPLAAALLADWAAAGSWEALQETVRFGRQAFTSGFAQLYLQGPWSRYLVDFLLISPWPVLFYLIWLGVVVGGKMRDERIWFWAAVPILFMIGTAFFSLRNARYVMVLEVPLRMATVFLAAHWVAAGHHAGWRRAAAATALLALVWMDLQTFRQFVQIDLYETPTHNFLLMRRILIG